MSKRFFVLCFSIFIVTGIYSQNVGIGTTTPTARLHVTDSSVLFSANSSFPPTPGNPPISGGGRRMMWYADKAAFRVGRVTSTYWDRDSIGLNSFAVGYDAKAKGNTSVAIGGFVNALKDYSIAIGRTSSARGNESLALGINCETEGDYSTALGFEATARGLYSMAIGTDVIARAYLSTAMGVDNDFITTSSPNSWVATDPLFIIGNGTSSGTRSNAMMVLKNGNVGLGTNNPLQKLDINGNVSVNNYIILLRDGNDFNHGLRYKSSVDGPYLFGFGGGSLGAANGRDALRWDHMGNVAVTSSLLVDTAETNSGDLGDGCIRFGGWSGEAIGSKRTAGGNQNGLDFYTSASIRMAITQNGNVGIGTTTPASKLEVNGETKTASLKVGSSGTSLTTIQKGTVTIGSNATAFKTVTVNFANSFPALPTLTATVRNDPGWNVNDTFVVSVRSLTPTSVTFNILRVDVAGGWNQNLLLDWIAVQ